MKFNMWKATDGQHYWNLKSANNEIIAHGEGYKNRQDCIDAVRLVMGTNINTTFTEG